MKGIITYEYHKIILKQRIRELEEQVTDVIIAYSLGSFILGSALGGLVISWLCKGG